MPEGEWVEAEKREKDDDGKPDVVYQTNQPAPRDFYIKKTDAERHGYTRGCGGCTSWFKGLSRQLHTADCRERFMGLMKDEAKVRRAEEQKAEFERRKHDKRT